jgi:hypothetical protein
MPHFVVGFQHCDHLATFRWEGLLSPIEET